MVDIQAAQSEIENKRIVAQKGMVDAQAGAMYKQAQTTEKMAKAEAHQVDSALKPAQAIAEMQAKTQQPQQEQRRTI